MSKFINQTQPYSKGNIRHSSLEDSEVIDPVSLLVTPKPEAVTINDEGRFNATVTFNDESQKTSINNPGLVNWSSSDSSIIQIDSDGFSVAAALGTASIRAESSENPNIFEEFEVMVQPAFSHDYVLTVGNFDNPYGGGYGFSSIAVGAAISPEQWIDGIDLVEALNVFKVGTGDTVSNLSSSNDTTWQGATRIRITWKSVDNNFAEIETVHDWQGTYYTGSGQEQINNLFTLLSQNVGKDFYISVAVLSTASTAAKLIAFDFDVNGEPIND